MQVFEELMSEVVAFSRHRTEADKISGFRRALQVA
jgi:hypothetical protein